MEAGVLFVGTGVSAAVPQLSHVFAGINSDPVPALDSVSGGGNVVPAEENEQKRRFCHTCRDAWRNPDSPNHRNNVSIVARFERNGKWINLMVDCGKTFRDAALRTFLPNNLTKVDAVFLTHDHQDAMGGLDDLRELQQFSRPIGPDGKRMFFAEERIPLFLSRVTFGTLQNRFTYIVNNSAKRGPQTTKVAVADFNIIDTDACAPADEALPQFTIKENIQITVLPVFHGKEYTCLGLSFGPADARIVFLSDVSAIPERVERHARSLQRIKLLVVDTCYFDKAHPSHFSLVEALEVIQRWEPETAYLVGMSCEIEHEAGCRYLEEWLNKKKIENPDFKTKHITLAYDGLFFPHDI